MKSGPLILLVIGFVAFAAWRAGLIPQGIIADASTMAENGSGTGRSALETYKYPAIATGLIIVVLFFFWKNTPAVVKYPLVTVAVIGWLYVSAK